MKNWLKEFIIGSIIILLFRIPIEIYYKKLDTASILFGCFMILVWELTREYLNRQKKEPEPIITEWEKQITKLTENTILLSERLKELKSKSIPDYKKGTKEDGLMIVGQSGGKETIVRSDGKEILLKGKPIIFETPHNFYEEWSKQLNEYLKGKGFKNDEPFGMAPIEYKDSKCNHSSLTFTCKTGVTTCSFCKEVIKPKTPIAPPLGFNHDFHKGMLESEKELDKVCKNIEVDCKCDGENSMQNIFSFEFNNVSVRQKKCFDCGKITVTHRY